jgi:hypothetical protein
MNPDRRLLGFQPLMLFVESAGRLPQPLLDAQNRSPFSHVHEPLRKKLLRALLPEPPQSGRQQQRAPSEPPGLELIPLRKQAQVLVLLELAEALVV